MADEQDRAESLDDDVVADEEDVIRKQGGTSDDERFGQIPALEEEYPPDEPMGAEDPGRFEIEDDLATRESRRSKE